MAKTPPTLHDFLVQASEVAEGFFKPDGQMLAYFLAEKWNGERTLIACPMSGPADERAFRIGVPRTLRAAGFARWCFFTEAWAARYGDGEPPAYPREREDRIEVVIFAAEHASTGEQLIARQEITRDPDGRGRLLPLTFSERRTDFVIDPNRPATPEAPKP